MLTIFAVSDSIGETAEQVAEASASQFPENVEVKRVPYVKSLGDVEDLIKDIKECEKAMIAYLKSNCSAVMQKMEQTAALDADSEKALADGIAAFKNSWA